LESTIAIFKYSQWAERVLGSEIGGLFDLVSKIELTIASLVILYVFTCYVVFYLKKE
jgi:hypothetical protein